MKNIIGQHHFIFSVENPLHPSKLAVTPTHEQALQYLKDQGEDVMEAHGHYGSPERSLIVMNPKNPTGLKQLVQDLGQESIIHSKNGKHEMHFLNGPNRGQVIHGEGTEVYGKQPADMFTTVKDEHGDPIHFKHNFNFSKSEKDEGEDRYCTMFLFEGVDKPDILHVTHKYFGRDYKEKEKIIETLEAWFKEHPFKEFTVNFDQEDWFGENEDVFVLRPKSNKEFLLDLKAKLDELLPDKWPEYKPHTSVSGNVECIDYPIVDYALVNNGKVVWSVKGKLYKSELLVKTPLPHTSYDIEEAKDVGLPDFHNDEDYIHVKTKQLPNGLEYKQFKHKLALPHQKKMIHALYDPRDTLEPVAYMETAHEEDTSQPKGYHPHAVQWSETHPLHRGKGLGRQLYLATLLHGTGGRLTSDERVSPEAHKMWESFKTYPGLGGKISFYPKGNELLFRPGLTDKASERHHVIIRDKRKLNHEQMFPFVNLGINNLAASEKDEAWLVKAVDERAWNRITKNHNKAVREDVVDSHGHIDYFHQNQPAHPEYKMNVLHHPKAQKADASRGMGAAPKMIHTVSGPDSETKFMAKPYHAPIEKWASSWTKHPIKGWASLTTKKLFDAAGMSDLAEDISAHIHKGVPIIVSKFHPGAQESYGMDEPFNPKDVAKISIMDFLTNNQDRHAGNIMRVNGHQPLAIDHERNFQYFKPKPGDESGAVSPFHALNNSGFAYKNRALPSQVDIFGDELFDWWKNSRHNIKKEMQKNLKFIKDPAIKRHIAENFNARWEWMNDHVENSAPADLFDKHALGVHPLPYVKGK